MKMTFLKKLNFIKYELINSSSYNLEKTKLATIS